MKNQKIKRCCSNCQYNDAQTCRCKITGKHNFSLGYYDDCEDFKLLNYDMYGLKFSDIDWKYE